MSSAKNHQVIASTKEVHTADLKVGQRPSVNLDEDREELIQTVDGANAAITGDYGDELKFNEEPVTIVIQRGSEKHAPNVVDCWVQGRGAEQFINGRWAVCGWLPVGVPVITKRKYVEVLARAKHDSVQTRSVKHEEHEDNFADRTTSSKYPFTVRNDSERGHRWLSKILMEG